MDHIWEIVDYYDRLEKMEEEAKEDLEKAIKWDFFLWNNIMDIWGNGCSNYSP